MTHIAPSPHHHIAVFVMAGVFAGSTASAGSPFATRVVAYSPAPGQFVSDPSFNDPAEALGQPEGMGTSDGNNVSVVNLGGFGGYIVLGFDHTVLDDPLNPLGLDAIVFSNAFWVGGNPDRHWAECATIEISRDENANGLADDPWYLITGSHLTAPLARSQISWGDGSTTYAYQLPLNPFGAMVVVNPVAGTENEGIYGYAEYSPTLFLGDRDGDDQIDNEEITAEEFYTTPDDPFEVGMTPGSGGGDAFDIAWAVDAATGVRAELDGFDFIRLTTPVHVIMPPLGEKSAEIDAVADVSPDPFGDTDADGDIDLADVASLQVCTGASSISLPECHRVALPAVEFIGLRDAALLIDRMTGPR
jgi:hypothetical protein